MDFFNARHSTMIVNDLTATLHLPERLQQRYDGRGDEISQSLPPGCPRSAFLVDEFIQAPNAFRRSTSTEKSYMVPVKADRGMWLDFTSNSYHSHDVAVVVSINGINALTTRPVTSTRLEQYRNKCPKHMVPFGADRLCPQCGWKWPGQNYLSTTTGKTFWLDGFRTEDGTVRQFYFTNEQERDVAKAVLGENSVPAIGIAFYLSKEPKPRPAPVARSFGLESCFPTRGMTRGGDHLGIAAGAKIHQDTGLDPKDLGYWSDEPAGIIIINYVTETQMTEISQGGMHKQNNEGPFGNGLPFGTK